jgi:hypothetical protein
MQNPESLRGQTSSGELFVVARFPQIAWLTLRQSKCEPNGFWHISFDQLSKSGPPVQQAGIHTSSRTSLAVSTIKSINISNRNRSQKLAHAARFFIREPTTSREGAAPFASKGAVLAVDVLAFALAGAPYAGFACGVFDSPRRPWERQSPDWRLRLYFSLVIPSEAAVAADEGPLRCFCFSFFCLNAVIPNPVARFWRTLERDLLFPFRPSPLSPLSS